MRMSKRRAADWLHTMLTWLFATAVIYWVGIGMYCLFTLQPMSSIGADIKFISIVGVLLVIGGIVRE